MEVKGRTAGHAENMMERAREKDGAKYKPYEEVEGARDKNRVDPAEDEEEPVGAPPPEPESEDTAPVAVPPENPGLPSKAEQEQHAEWVQYYDDIKNYMIRYAAYHAGLRAQRNVEEALALRAAQAAVATAQHISVFEKTTKDTKGLKR
eukprot:TRINITY_DN17683_c0_g1_i1.p1 TRINITY_DN17683_c0_g1~~TRINITY_DN17683_c0_g1_i1.p1  ORF type:complete len:149 (+),score=31.31 TRINITY_DN17683_c0_g1_i1:46-492(+)